MASNCIHGLQNDLNVAEGSRKQSNPLHTLTVDGLEPGVNIWEKALTALNQQRG
jgi:hypothetical protein